MPFEPSRAVTFLGQVRKILEFQSTVDILKRMFNQPVSICLIKSILMSV